MPDATIEVTGHVVIQGTVLYHIKCLHCGNEWYMRENQEIAECACNQGKAIE